MKHNLLSSHTGKTVAKLLAALLIVATLSAAFAGDRALAQSDRGEIQGRPAPVALRKCLGGANAGNLCNEDADCPASSCVDRNIFNISVAVHFDATDAQLDVIEAALTDLSALLFDVTDGQAEIGQATIHNNAYGTAADIRIYPSSAPVWWQANTGGWKVGGSIHVSYDHLSTADAPGESFAHEFVHLVFDAKDEYESANIGCTIGNIGSEHCPDAAAIAAGENASLMDVGGLDLGDPGTELCWGHGDAANLTDVSHGNHDATDVTEQSRCRDNRSVWDQVAWAFPDTILPPAGAPDPDANGAIVDDVKFIRTDDTVRAVLVLDQSGSMASESPSRIERLKVAAGDYVTLAESGSELGLVSYSSDADPAHGYASVPIAPLGADRSDWTDAIAALSATWRTNIGDGLRKAKDMIDDAGGVTANTFIILMTDGLNNEPSPQATADADLQAEIDTLLLAGIPVYVTCTGSDQGLDSQCAEIASGTNGFYVDSADAWQLAERFVDMHEMTQRRQGIDSSSGILAKAVDQVVYVEEGAHSATFTLVWESAQASAELMVLDPKGTVFPSAPMPQGRYVRVPAPMAGDWRMVIKGESDVESPYVARAYVKNQLAELGASVRYPSVLPGKEITVFAYPRYSGAIGLVGEKIAGTVTRPDGSTDTIVLLDQGRAAGTGDDLGDDGIYTGVYRDTAQEGAYTIVLSAEFDGWQQSGDTPKRDPNANIPRFRREVSLSAVIDDGKGASEVKEPGAGFQGWPWVIGGLLLVAAAGLFLVLIRRSSLLRRRSAVPA